MKYLVIYHANCCDGMAAALGAHQWLCDAGQIEDAAFLPLNYGDDAPTVDKSTHVLMVDFTMKLHQMIGLAQDAASVTVYDHHKTAMEDLGHLLEEGVVQGVFDMSRSGAGLVWDELLGYRPPLINYIEDYDLWKFDLDATNAVHEGLLTIGFSFEAWYPLIEDPEELSALIGRGSALYGDKMRRVAAAVGEHMVAECLVQEYGAIAMVNCPYELSSAVGSELSKTFPYAAMYHIRKDGKIAVSLRSSKGNPDHADVGAIAQKFGGGGHANAAGFIHSL